MSIVSINLTLAQFFSGAEDASMLSCFSCVQLFATDTMNCNPPGSSIHGRLQGRILEWVAISSSRESSQLRDWVRSLLYLLHWQVGFFYHCQRQVPS